jgi:hypothetical protein
MSADEDEAFDLIEMLLRVAINYANRMAADGFKDTESWVLIRRVMDRGFGAPLPEEPKDLTEPIQLRANPLSRIT